MKTKDTAETKDIKDFEQKEIPGFTINPDLNNKYNNEPFFKEKVDKANEILKKAGVPKF